MGKPSRKSKGVNVEEIKKKQEIHRQQCKQHAVDLLKNCLSTQLMDESDALALINETSLHLGIPTQTHTHEQRSEENEQPPQKPKFPATAKPSSRKSGSDEHNEVCDVCEKGGDLLCCDTCTLVFHLKCLRPKMTAIPKTQWSCPYCIVDNVAPGDQTAAKKAIEQMTRAAHGLDPEEADDPTFRLGKAGEIFIVYSGKKYIVRKRARRQIEELGRFSTLQEALMAIPSIEDTKNIKKRLSKESVDNELWCTHCLDDPYIELCAFCGCKKCFGKHETALMVLCDQCERETHTFCMQPPVRTVPEEDPWYCETCLRDNPPQADEMSEATTSNIRHEEIEEKEIDTEPVNAPSDEENKQEEEEVKESVKSPQATPLRDDLSFSTGKLSGSLSFSPNLHLSLSDAEPISLNNTFLGDEGEEKQLRGKEEEEQEKRIFDAMEVDDMEIVKEEVTQDSLPMSVLGVLLGEEEKGEMPESPLKDHATEVITEGKHDPLAPLIVIDAEDVRKFSEQAVDSTSIDFGMGMDVEEDVQTLLMPAEPITAIASTPAPSIAPQSLFAAVSAIDSESKPTQSLDILSPQVVPFSGVGGAIQQGEMGNTPAQPNAAQNPEIFSHDVSSAIPQSDPTMKFRPLSSSVSYSSFSSSSASLGGSKPPQSSLKRRDVSGVQLPTSMTSSSGGISQGVYPIPRSKSFTQSSFAASHSKRPRLDTPFSAMIDHNAVFPHCYAPDNIERMIAEMNTRKITPADMDVLELVRVWAPKGDLERTISALCKTRDSLLKRLHSMDPGIAKEFVVKNEIGEMINVDLIDET